jgi:predicted XRE-type DNA-binding protein
MGLDKASRIRLSCRAMTTQAPIYETVMAHIRAKRIPQQRVAIESGVPYSTLTKIAQGQIKAPSVHHVQALYDYFVRADENQNQVSS